MKQEIDHPLTNNQLHIIESLQKRLFTMTELYREQFNIATVYKDQIKHQSILIENMQRQFGKKWLN